MKPRNLTGNRFGRLTVIGRVGVTRDRAVLWECVCLCGGNTVVSSSRLFLGTTRSCGCLIGESAKQRFTKHGKKRTRAYSIWRGMKQRCSYKNHVEYIRYGARGITVCKEWGDFRNFYADMGDPPPGASIDRIDSTKGYCKTNCRWVTAKEQQRNKSNNRYLTHRGETKLMVVWAEESGLTRSQLKDRIDKLGWSVEKALLTPVLRQKGNGRKYEA